MSVMYAILSISGWIWLLVAFAFLLFAEPKNKQP